MRNVENAEVVWYELESKALARFLKYERFPGDRFAPTSSGVSLSYL